MEDVLVALLPPAAPVPVGAEVEVAVELTAAAVKFAGSIWPQSDCSVAAQAA